MGSVVWKGAYELLSFVTQQSVDAHRFPEINKSGGRRALAAEIACSGRGQLRLVVV